MTATTPPIIAWYVLEVEGTGLASAQAGGEKREKGLRPCRAGGRGCCSPRAPSWAGSSILLRILAARMGKAAGEAKEKSHPPQWDFDPKKGG